jgi:hypothetical protein
MNEIVDVYFSQKAFTFFKTHDNVFLEDESICEAKVNGEWVLFTEQITPGKKALSKWDDLVFLGTASETRYTNAIEWHEKQSV